MSCQTELPFPRFSGNQLQAYSQQANVLPLATYPAAQERVLLLSILSLTGLSPEPYVADTPLEG